MFQKIHARYEERGLVPRHGPASAAGVMGMKVDERHRQGDMQTPKHGKSFKTTNTTEENIKEKQGRARHLVMGVIDLRLIPVVVVVVITWPVCIRGAIAICHPFREVKVKIL